MFDESENKKYLLITLVITNVLMLAIIGYLIFGGKTKEKVENNKELIFVEISGAVAEPGVYEIESSKRLIDLINLAGGFTEAARVELVNLATPLKDGVKYYIPNDAENDDAGKIGGKININTASLEVLMELKGIGKVKAQAIIDYRTLHGPFTDIRELMNVKGIGEKTFAAIKDDICC